MNIKDIKKRIKHRIIENIIGEDITEIVKNFESILSKDILRGKYLELKKINANLIYVSFILAYTSHEKTFIEQIIGKRKKYKNNPSFENLLEKNRMRLLTLSRAGEEKFFEKSIDERMEALKKIKKYPEWYLDRAILDLGSYFEAISPPDVRQVAERRQYQLIAKLLVDFDLFKQSFNKAWNEHSQNWDEAEREEHARERVVKRAEAINAKIWKERILGEKERLQKTSPHPIL